jgi:hypothetical protein
MYIVKNIDIYDVHQPSYESILNNDSNYIYFV